MTIATIRTFSSSAVFAFLTRSARTLARDCLAISLCFALLGNVALTQEIDSSTLQKEGAAQPAASQNQESKPQPLQNPKPMNQLPAAQPPASQPPLAQAGSVFT